jgi:hypothetical protein
MTEEEIVQAFSKEMYKKIQLRHARYTPMGWKTMDIRRLLMLLKEEIKELEDSNNNEERAHEAVDIANYAMFIWSLCGQPIDSVQPTVVG